MATNNEVKFSILEKKGDHHTTLAIEPLDKGYGHTLGNALRRVMLGYLYGAAITRVKVNDAPHEFSVLKGVSEDVVQLVQNLKGIQFNMEQKKVHIVTLDLSGGKDVTAADLNCPTGVEVINKDHHIVTLSDAKSKLSLELTVEYGQGYRLPEEQEKKSVGVIMIDANFSPVRLVSYHVEKTRIGREINLDRLVMDVHTDGSITPQQAIQRAAAILKEKFEYLAGDDIQVYKPGEEEEKVERESEARKVQPKVYLEELNLPTRVLNTLKSAGYEVVGDLKAASEDEIRKIKNIGPKTVDLLLKKIKEYD